MLDCGTGSGSGGANNTKARDGCNRGGPEGTNEMPEILSVFDRRVNDPVKDALSIANAIVAAVYGTPLPPTQSGRVITFAKPEAQS